MDLAIIQNKIFEIRGKRVMLDFDLAQLYEVTTSALNQAVKRNLKRFPADFMFQLTFEEYTNLKSQIVTSSWGGTRKLPNAFTEQGVAMREYVTNTNLQSIEIRELKAKIKALEVADENVLGAVNNLSEDLQKEMDDIYMALAELSQKNLVATEQQNRNKIGFKK
jgi:ORF6N domain